MRNNFFRVTGLYQETHLRIIIVTTSVAPWQEPLLFCW